jgi:hypothetical protein
MTGQTAEEKIKMLVEFVDDNLNKREQEIFLGFFCRRFLF